MANQTDYLVRDSDNQITLTLTEDGTAISNTPTQIEIDIGGVIQITRSPTGDGVAFSSGVLTITPSDLTEDLSSLQAGRLYRVKIVITDGSQPDGVVFGANDSDAKQYFLISDRPT